MTQGPLRRRREFPVGAFGWLITGASLLPFLVLTAYGGSYWLSHQHRQQRTQIQDSAVALARAVDRELRGHMDTVQVLGRSRQLQSGDLRAFDELARDAAAGSGAHFLLADVTGQQLINTRSSRGAPLPMVADAEGYVRTMAGRRPHVSELTLGAVAKQYLVGIRVPIEVNGEIRYVLTYIPRAHAFLDVVKQNYLPEGWFAAILDGNGRIVARSTAHEDFYGRKATQEFLGQLVGKSGLVESVDLEGRTSLTGYHGSDLSAWKVVVWAPRVVLNGPLREAMQWLVGAVALTLAASLGASWLSSTVISGPARQLVRVAQDLGSGRPVTFQPTSLREANVAGFALADASTSIAQREAKLRESETALRERDETLRLALSAASAYAFTWDLAADQVERLQGYPITLPLRPATTLESHLKSVHPEDRDRVRSDIKAALRPDAGPYRSEYRLAMNDGRTSWISDFGIVERAADGSPKRLIGIAMDITEKKNAQIAHEESLQRLSVAFRLAPVAMAIATMDEGRQVEVNEARLKLTGHTREDMIGRTPEEIGFYVDPERDFPRLRREMRENGEVSSQEFELRRKNGEAFIGLISAGPIPLDGKPHLLATIVDITERKRAESHTQLLLREVNHRSKNLLAVTQAIARQTASRSSPAEFVSRFTARIQALAASHDLVVRSEWRGVDIGDLVHAQLAHLESWMGSRIKVHGPPLKITATAAQGIGMALHELATNAAKYGALSGPDGAVEVSWAVADRDGRSTFSIRWQETGGPKVTPPSRRGFGQTVIVNLAQAAVKGEARLDFLETGGVWELKGPIEAVCEDHSVAA